MLGERRIINLMYQNDVDLLREQQVIQIGAETQHGRMIHAGSIQRQVDVGALAKIPHGTRAEENRTPHAAYSLELLDYASKIDLRYTDSAADLHARKLESLACNSSNRIA